jgi:hypothetical protein
MKLDLSDVTICAIDSVNMALAARALHVSMAQCRFADAILFSHAPVDGEFRNEIIPKVNSTAEYSSFLWKRVPTFVDTPFALIVQWDGFVTDAGAWRPEFRDYDYIGARWPFLTDGMSVGNGGFSLRSRKFMSALMQPRFVLDESANCDWQCCRTYRPALESDYGVRFAPEDVADLFSHELAPPSQNTFGFHSLENMWRYVEDAEMVELVDRLDPYVCRTYAYAKLILAYFAHRRWEPLAALYAKMKKHVDDDKIEHTIKVVALDEADAIKCMRKCERLLFASARSESLRRAYGKAKSIFARPRSA